MPLVPKNLEYIEAVKINLESISNQNSLFAYGAHLFHGVLPSYATFRRTSGWGDFRKIYDFSVGLWVAAYAGKSEWKKLGWTSEKLERTTADEDATYLGKPIVGIDITHTIAGLAKQLIACFDKLDWNKLVDASLQRLSLFEFQLHQMLIAPRYPKNVGFIRTFEQVQDEQDVIWNSPQFLVFIEQEMNFLDQLKSLDMNFDLHNLKKIIDDQKSVRKDVLGNFFCSSDLDLPEITDREPPSRSSSSWERIR
jgi:hypothetical protein